MPSVAVCSPSFSRNEVLVKELYELCPEAKINQSGVILQGQELIDFLKGFEIALVGTEKFSKDIFDQLTALKFIAKYGVGFDNIDQQAMQSAGVRMAWQGGVNRRAVAEMTLVFLNGLARNIFFSGYALKQGRWEKQGGYQLTGKTVGILGCGYVGSEVVKLLKPFNCKLLISDILDKTDFLEERRALGDQIEQVDQSYLMANSDFISLHVPLTELTKNLINIENLSKMKPGAFLVNTSRGGVVNQKDLAQALVKGPLAGAALDVFEIEPPEDLEFLALPNLMVTPHIGGNAWEAVLSMGRSALLGVQKYFDQVVV